MVDLEECEKCGKLGIFEGGFCSKCREKWIMELEKRFVLDATALKQRIRKYELKCKKCSYDWETKRGRIPAICPNCKSKIFGTKNYSIVKSYPRKASFEDTLNIVRAEELEEELEREKGLLEKLKRKKKLLRELK